MKFVRIHNLKTSTYELFVAFFLSWFAVSGAILFITKNVTPMGKMDTLLLYGLMSIFFLSVFGVFYKRLKGWQLVVPVCFFCVLLIATLSSSQSNANLEILINLIITCFPFFFLVGCVRDFSSLYRFLLIIMQIAPYIHILAYFLLGSGQLEEDETYSQDMSYKYLFPAIVLLSDVLYKFSFKSFFPFLICIFFVVAYGARGPLVSLFLFTILYIVLMSKSLGIKTVLFSVLFISGVAVYFITHLDQVIDYLINLMNSLNTSVRVLQMVMDESFAEDNARSSYAAECWKRIFDNPFWGTGPINDRVYLWNIFHFEKGVAGMYPHNFFVEVLTQYGLIFGLVIIYIFFIIIYKSVKYSVNIETKKLLLVFIGAYFFPLLFSGSYISSQGFYVLMAFCIVILKIRKTKTLSYVRSHSKSHYISEREVQKE